MPISQAAVGWLMLLAAFVLFAAGCLLRLVIGRRPDTHLLCRIVRRFRHTRIARLLFGPVHGDPLHPDELDQMILMPTVVVACGLCLTALFLLGYDTLT